ncbi:hypothetical protein AAY42_10105 [Flagellimonas eckloniae]|uniref:Phage head morphogenesis domain-containing protein n=2 Tax=Flagellimonas eckloniae TaxID=346185 RepID=A0A0Q0WXH6_9FLAO|nr:hypothetical protein AAY42_10105 [Allomuricauda eckloniae]
MITKIAKDLFNNKLKPTDLHKGLIDRTFKELNTAAKAGFGAKYATDATGIKMQQHLFRFSVAKTYQQLEQMHGFLVDKNGKLVSYPQFEKKVQQVHETFNRTYLQSEHRTVKRSSQAARQWAQYQSDKDIFPNLEYIIVGDDKVREEHEKLSGIILPLDDFFWNDNYPPNGHQCRCSARPTDKKANGRRPKIDIHPAFRNNVGKTGVVFAENGHPYFTMDKKANKAYKEYLDGQGK